VVLDVLDHALEGTGPTAVLLGGESAGAYLAMAALIRLRDEHDAARLIAGVDLSWGIYDWGGSPSQAGRRPSVAPDLLDPEGLARTADWYLPGLSAEQRRSPAISPAFAALTGLPPAFLAVGTADHLLDDTLVLAARWTAASSSGAVELFVAPDLPHSFPMVACALTDRWAAARDAWWRRLLR
jgi:acetyl esterase